MRRDTQVPHDSTHTMMYVGMTPPTLEETVERFATQQDDRKNLSIGAFDGDKIIGYLNFRLPMSDHPWVQQLWH